MEKMVKSKLTGVFILAGIIPVVLLTVYFSFQSSGLNIAGKPNTPNVLQSEKNNAVSLTARNSWYLTMILRKVELAGRMGGDVIAGVFKRQNAFFTQEDYRKIKTDAGGKFLWSPEKEGGVLFVSGSYKEASKDGKIPVIGAYLDSTLSLIEKNGTVIESVYIMTETAVRKYPWAKIDDLVKTGLYKVGNYKIKADSLFMNEDSSPYRIAGPDLNKSRMEIWTEAYWNQESKSWMISYFMPLYIDGVYKGVLGADISLQKLLEKLIGKDQAKKFTYPDTFPAVLTKNGVLAASSIYGYDMLKIDGAVTAQSDLKSYGNEGFQSSLSRVLDPKFWENTTRDEELGGVESVSVNKKEYYLAHFPVRTGGLSLVLFIPAVNLEKSAAVSVTTAKSKSSGINIAVLGTGLLCTGLSIVFMVILLNYVSKNTELSSEDGTLRSSATMLTEEKKIFDDKLREFGERNTELGNQLEKVRTELKEALAKNGGAKPDLSQYISINEFNMKLEAERKGLLLKISEIEKSKNDFERRLNEKTAEYRKLIMQPGTASGEPDPNKYIKIEDYNKKLETERKNFISKVNELEKVGAELEVRFNESKIDKNRLEEKLSELTKNSSSKNGNDQGMVQRLGEVQKANDGFKENFEKLKGENEQLVNKVKSLENEGRNLAEMLVSKFEEEKKNYNIKVEELNKQVNIEASRVVELENKIKTDSVKLAQMDPSRFIPLAEVNTRIEADRKNFVLKIQELENRLKTAVEKPDPARFVPLDKVNEEKAAREKENKDEVAVLEKKLMEAAAVMTGMKQLEEKNKALEEKLVEVSQVAAGAKQLEQKDKELEAKQNEMVFKLQEREQQFAELQALKNREVEAGQKEQADLSAKLQEAEKQLGELNSLRELAGAKDNEIQEKQRQLAELEEKNNSVLKEKEEYFEVRLAEMEKKVKAAEEKPVNTAEFMPVEKVADLVTERLEAQDQKYAGRIRDLEQALKAEKEKPVADLSAYVPLSELQAKIEEEKKSALDRINQLETAVRALNQEKTGLAVQLAEVASSKDAAQKVMATVGEATRRMEEDKLKASGKVRELEMIKLDLEQKYMLLVNENKKMTEALNVVEGRKKETDKQAQSLILKVGEDQQALKEKIKDLEEQKGELTAERDAARKHYEIMRKELEQEQAKPLPVFSVETKTDTEDKQKRKLEMVIERTSAFKSDLNIEEPGKEKPVEKSENNETDLKSKTEQAGGKHDSFDIYTAPSPAAPVSSPEHSEEEENNLLVVDDKGEIIKIFGDSLYNMGYSVYIARNAKLAKQKLTMGNYRNVIISASLADGDYKEFFESVKKGDAKYAERIVFYNNEETKDKEFLSDKKIMKSGSTEVDIKKLMI
ncbi:MAG: hypothetical protein A2452_06105 [Candidatus Firestonebacteria bacterium RIFOXYC2_FULL_39_67]|nr:MAG: hypothetical protein A2536_12360 [Candidatus Firestonebacteria bacterium RIFOXYD2_FULL_39_29]OGF56659.1 MAG: hypothetical protein A2452_06105 [Candidatus Firestonebacteria bacterium RIFOXYC2_FULL_39_67]OGF57134.1 MAG: hypothetical protein A2497_04650 [Candidatus Firestonebacteria bacterium RifOxyC12_full_39_7]